LTDPLIILSVILAVVLSGELVATGTVHWLKSHCQWIITPQDLTPAIDSAGLQRFLDHGWDSELGWVRKSNTSGIDKGWGETHATYQIGAQGARLSPSFETAPMAALAYGDSYTFCRQISDGDTWPEKLSLSLNGRVANFGVGNYGIDQALLRLEREFDEHPAPIVIMGIVPETINRILSLWKHFSEYGNVFAFKPMFTLDNNKSLQLIANPAYDPKQFLRINELLPELKKQDFFFMRKFMADMLRFPYLWHLWRSRHRNIPLLKTAFTDRCGHTNHAAFNEVMMRNIELAAKLFSEKEPTDLLAGITKRFADFVHGKGATPVLIFLPQLYDLKHIRTGDHYYADFIDKISKYLTVIDLGPVFAKEANDSQNYINDQYGGHLSSVGNKIAAQTIGQVIEPLLNQQRPTS